MPPTQRRTHAGPDGQPNSATPSPGRTAPRPKQRVALAATPPDLRRARLPHSVDTTLRGKGRDGAHTSGGGQHRPATQRLPRERTAPRPYQRPPRPRYQAAGAPGVPTKRTQPTVASGAGTLAPAAAGSCPGFTARVAVARFSARRGRTGAGAAGVGRHHSTRRGDRVSAWPARRAPAGGRARPPLTIRRVARGTGRWGQLASGRMPQRSPFGHPSPRFPQRGRQAPHNRIQKPRRRSRR